MRSDFSSKQLTAKFRPGDVKIDNFFIIFLKTILGVTIYTLVCAWGIL